MGTCKDEMKTSKSAPVTPKKDGSEKLFGLIRKRPKADEAGVTVADLIDQVDRRLPEIIAAKRTELKSESGREAYNARALAILETMARLNDAMVDLAVDYSELK